MINENRNIEDFENFIYAVEGILINAESTVIEFKPHMNKELWEKNSFLASGKMNTAIKTWREGSRLRIIECLHKSKSKIKHIVLVDQNTIIINHLKSELKKSLNSVEEFKIKYDMHKSEVLLKNRWFLELGNIMDEYAEWFNEITDSLIISKSSSNASDLPEIDLTTQKEQIRLIYDLGIIDFLQKKYPKTLNNKKSQVAQLISKILKLKYGSVQPSINELLSDKVGKNYPKETPKTKAIIDKLNANESK